MFAKLLVSILLFFNPNMRLDAIKAASNTTSFITNVPTIVSLNNSTEMKNACKDIEGDVKAGEERIEQERIAQEQAEAEEAARQAALAAQSYGTNNNYSYQNNYSTYTAPSYDYTPPAMTMGNYGRLVVGGTSWVLDSNGGQDVVDRGDCWVGEGYPTIFGAHWNLGFTAIEYASTATWYKPDGSVVTLYKVWEDWNGHNYGWVSKSNGEYYFNNPAAPIAMYTCTSTSGNDVYLSYWTY
jgi:hypothetical protein